MKGFNGAYNEIFGVGQLKDIDGNPVGTGLSLTHEDSSLTIEASNDNPGIYINSETGNLDLALNPNWGGAYLTIPNAEPMVLSWKNNGDGTHTLIGREP